VRQDRRLEPGQFRAGVDPVRLVQHGPRLPVGGQGVGLPSGPVQGGHELAPEPLPERVLLDQAAQLLDDLGVLAQGEVGLDPALQGREPQLLETRGLAARPVAVGELGAAHFPPRGLGLVGQVDGVVEAGGHLGRAVDAAEPRDPPDDRWPVAPTHRQADSDGCNAPPERRNHFLTGSRTARGVRRSRARGAPGVMG
jgi:hypothetical protein